jgi:hypothetical protein
MYVGMPPVRKGVTVGQPLGGKWRLGPDQWPVSSTSVM